MKKIKTSVEKQAKNVKLKLTKFNFPELWVVVEAENIQEATQKAHKLTSK